MPSRAHHFYNVQDVFVPLFIATIVPNQLSLDDADYQKFACQLTDAKTTMTGKYKSFYDTVVYCASEKDLVKRKMSLLAALLQLKQLLREEPQTRFQDIVQKTDTPITPEKEMLLRLKSLLQDKPQSQALVSGITQRIDQIDGSVALETFEVTLKTAQQFIDSIANTSWLAEATESLEKWLMHYQTQLQASPLSPTMLERFAEAKLIAAEITTRLADSPSKSSFGTMSEVVERCFNPEQRETGFIILKVVAKDTQIAILLKDKFGSSTSAAIPPGQQVNRSRFS
jgi:hypothetical protein